MILFIYTLSAPSFLKAILRRIWINFSSIGMLSILFYVHSVSPTVLSKWTGALCSHWTWWNSTRSWFIFCPCRYLFWFLHLSNSKSIYKSIAWDFNTIRRYDDCLWTRTALDYGGKNAKFCWSDNKSYGNRFRKTVSGSNILSLYIYGMVQLLVFLLFGYWLARHVTLTSENVKRVYFHTVCYETGWLT